MNISQRRSTKREKLTKRHWKPSGDRDMRMSPAIVGFQCFLRSIWDAIRQVVSRRHWFPPYYHRPMPKTAVTLRGVRFVAIVADFDHRRSHVVVALEPRLDGSSPRHSGYRLRFSCQSFLLEITIKVNLASQSLFPLRRVSLALGTVLRWHLAALAEHPFR